MLDAKRQMIETGDGLDWATAEALAFGTLLDRGLPRPPLRPGLRPRHLQPPPLRRSSTRRPRSATCRSTTSSPARRATRSSNSMLSEVRRPRLRVRLLPRRAERAHALGGPVRRLRQRRPDHDRPVHLVGRGEVAAHVGPRAAAAARLRGPGPRALLRPPRALPADVRLRQLDRRQLHHAGQLLPRPPPANPPQLPQAAGADDPEVAAPPQARGLQAQGLRQGLELPPRALGRRRPRRRNTASRRPSSSPTTRSSASSSARARSTTTCSRSATPAASTTST